MPKSLTAYQIHDVREMERNIRGMTLLKSWLSAAQRQSYESFNYFDVIGGDSGTIYRIHHGQQANCCR